MKKVADLLLINKKCKIVIKLKEAGEIKLNEEKTISLKKEQDELCKQKNSSKNIGVALGIIAIICIIAGIGTFVEQMVQVSIVAFVVRNHITRFNICKNKFF